MKIRTGHEPEDWSENVPSYARLPGVRGGPVQGAPGAVEVHRHAANAVRDARRAGKRAAAA